MSLGAGAGGAAPQPAFNHATASKHSRAQESARGRWAGFSLPGSPASGTLSAMTDRERVRLLVGPYQRPSPGWRVTVGAPPGKSATRRPLRLPAGRYSAGLTPGKTD